MVKIKVADIVIEYEPFHSDYFGDRFDGYLADESEQTDMTLKYELVDEIILPEHEIKKKVYDACIGETASGNRLVYLKSRATGKILNSYEFSPDYSYNFARAIHIEPNERVQLTDGEREYLKSGAVFNNRLIYEGGTTLHGSCIEYEGQGIVFSAPCGTGKSTHTSLWKAAFGDKVNYINDDKPSVREKNGVLTVSGAPWSGKTTLQSNKTVPLKAVVFIERAEKNSIDRLDTATSLCYLRDQTFPPYYDAALNIKNLELLEKIISSVPVYVLRCNMEEDAAITARNTIFKE